MFCFKISTVASAGTIACSLLLAMAAVPAAGGQNDRRSGVQTPVDRMDLDGRVVNADDAGNATRYRLAHVVFLSVLDPVGLEKRRVRRIERDDNAAGKDRFGTIGLMGLRTWSRNETGSWDLAGC